MRELPGNRMRYLGVLLPALIFLFAACAAECRAQATPCATPVILSVVPGVWDAGQTIKVTITGSNFYTPNGLGCALARVTVSEGTGLVAFSQANVVSPSEVDAVVTVPSTVPSETACVELAAISPTVVLGNASVRSDASAPCPDSGYETGFPVQIVGAGLTIASVTPLGWWAGQKQDITITGSGFLTSTDPGGPSQVTATASGVTLNNVQVVSATQITASVRVTKDASAETVTLTVTNPATGNGSPNSATANPVPVVLPVPVIQWRGKTISGDNAKTRKVKTGQPVELTTTPATLPGGFTIIEPKWDIDGTTIKQYHEDDDDGISVDETDLDTPNTSFYWLYPDTGLNVTYEYCAAGSDGAQYCTSPQAKATFNAAEPNIFMSTWDSREPSIEQLAVCTDNDKYAPYLGYGNLSGPAPGCPGKQDGEVGIKLPASGASGGKYVFVQIVDADFDLYTSPAPAGGSPAPPPIVCGPHAGLDKAYPFPGVNDPKSPTFAYDGPQMALPQAYASGTRNFHATMYLLWQPDQLSSTGTPSIPVPIGYQFWQFIATASQNPPIGNDKWNKHPTLTASGDEGQGFTPSSPWDNSIYGYPQWSYISSTICGVSQTIDANASQTYSLWNDASGTERGFSQEEQ